MNPNDTHIDDPEQLLLLDDLTGLAHKYEPGQGDESVCDCDVFQEAFDLGRTSIIGQRQLEVGIWKPAQCLECDEDE